MHAYGSFHGTVFAILFGKPFVSTMEPGQAHRSPLRVLGLDNRLLPPTSLTLAALSTSRATS